MSTPDTTQGPMAGVRVVEIGAWVAGPAVGAVLSDWGAEVVKVEPLAGDPFRYVINLGQQKVNPAFELENRGKRSLSLDVSSERGGAILAELLASADVFISNLRPLTLELLQLDPATLAKRFPTLIVATLNGFGDRGPDHNRPSYDLGGFWARSGLAASHTVDGGVPPLLRGAVGDHIAAMSLVAGICAALHARHATGAGRHVSTSLLRNGLYAGGQDANVFLRTGRTLPMGGGRENATNPLFSCYPTSDGRWLWLLGLQPDRHWRSIALALEHPEWLADERFGFMASRRTHAPALVALMDEAFLQRSLPDSSTILESQGIWWEPVLTVPEAVLAEQARESGAFVRVPVSDSAQMPDAIAGPVDFDGVAGWNVRRTPEFSEHTEEVLLELGRSWADIGVLREDGIIT